MFLLKIQWELLGLKAPAFSWIVSACLLVYAIYVYGTHLMASRNRQWLLSLAEERLASLRDGAPGRPGEGVTRSFYEAISSVFDDLPLLSAAWSAVASCVVVTDKDRTEKFWVSEDISGLVTGATAVDSRPYRTAPTVISGIGLLATFLAILVALMDVRLAQNRVQGLDLLVQGLSGKFLSSVVAIGCATMLIHAEKGLYRPCTEGLARLTMALKSLLPRLVPAQIMSDLRTEMAAQARMFGAFDVDLKGAVKEGLGESVRGALAALERMASLQDELNKFIRENEAEKQQAMTDQLKAALSEFGQSLGDSLDKMATKFDEALALNTHAQFKEISESLSSAATVLQQVNDQLGTNHYVLIDLLELARATTGQELEARQAQAEHLAAIVGDLMTKLQEKTADEMTARQVQTEQLAETVNQLMSNLQEKTAESMTSMDTTLATVTLNISERVMELSTQMASVIRETSEKSTTKAKEVMDQAGTLSTQSALRLADLLERHGSELTKVEQLKTLLDGAIQSFVSSIDKYSHLTDGLQRVTTQVNVGVASLSQTAKSLKDGQEAAASISTSLAEQAESMRGVSQNQGEVWERIKGSMVEYEKIFSSVEGQAGDMLGQIARHLEAYSETTERHFSSLAHAADTLVAQATGRLSGSIEELSEQLDDLHAALGGLSRVSQARR